MNIEPLRNNIMFRFRDETTGSKGKFDDGASASGIIIGVVEAAQKEPRWGQVVTAGPESGVKPGEYILIQGLRWSYGTEVDGEKLWKTDDDQVLMVTDDINETYMTRFK